MGRFRRERIAKSRVGMTTGAGLNGPFASLLAAIALYVAAAIVISVFHCARWLWPIPPV